MSRFVITATRTCTTCKSEKPPGDFSRYAYTTTQGKRSVRFDSRCKACNRLRKQESHAKNRERNNAQSRAWREANPEAMRRAVKRWQRANREASKAWRQANIGSIRISRIASEQRRRAGQAGMSTAEVRTAVETTLALAKVGSRYLDAYSGELIDRPTIDHIVPLASGGSGCADNLCVTSRANNASKFTASLLVWLVRREALRHAS